MTLNRKEPSSLTPHGIIEDMGDMLMHGNRNTVLDTFDLERWAKAAPLLKDAVLFDFSDAIPSPEHCEFGTEMFSRGLFALPFKTCLFVRGGMRTAGILVTMEDDPVWRPDAKLLGLPPGGEKGMVMIACGEARDMRSGLARRLPLLAGRASLVDRPEAKENIWFEYRCLTTTGQVSRKTGEQIDGAGYEDRVDRMFQYVVGSVAMLMSKDVEQRVTPAPDRLNKRRVLAGKLPIREMRTIIIKPHARSVLTGDEAQRVFGERRTPRMHMRRGHFRELAQPRKSDGATIVPVAPAVVNADERAGEVMSKGYRVEGSQS